MERTNTKGIAPRKTFGNTFGMGEGLAWIGVLLLIATLGAHFFRADNYLLTLCFAGILFFHCGSAPWKTFVVGVALAWGVLEWGVTIQHMIALRLHMGVPWMRGAFILGMVAMVTALGAWHTLKKAELRSSMTQEGLTCTQAAACILTFLALYFLRKYLPDMLILERFFPTWGGVQIFFLAWYAGYISGKLHTPRTSQKTRKIVWLVFTIVFYGQLVLGLSGIPEIARSGTPHVPIPAFILFAPAYRGSFSIMPYLVLAATLLVGSAWCSMLCYFGAIEANTASSKIIRKGPPFLEKALRYGRAVILVAGLATAGILRHYGAPIALALSLAAFFATVSLILMLFVSKKYTGMVHCTTFCPMGLVINVLGKLSPWRIRIDRQCCDGCGACETTCAYRAIDAASRAKGTASTTCSLCRDCIGSCPHHAISIKNFLLPPKISSSVFTVILVVLHVVFLSTARPM